MPVNPYTGQEIQVDATQAPRMIDPNMMDPNMMDHNMMDPNMMDPNMMNPYAPQVVWNYICIIIM